MIYLLDPVTFLALFHLIEILAQKLDRVNRPRNSIDHGGRSSSKNNNHCIADYLETLKKNLHLFSVD